MSTAATNRAELVAQAREGDSSAILALLRRCQPDIRRFARASCRIDDVDDAVQEALWVLSRRVGGLQKVAAFSSWLFQVVKRECLRLARRYQPHTDLEAVEDSAAFATKPDHELRLDLAMAIQSLPEHYRVLTLMRDVEERTVDEIAAALDLTRETVKARLHRARLLLREYLTR